ncbi:MAG: hypothetical protein WC543_05995 [Candidatus Omnitrophota bacterium]
MNNLDKLKSCALEINNLLNKYVELHNKVLKEAGTFRSVFRKVDFQGLYNEAKILSNDFMSKEIEIRELGNEINNSLTSLQKEFFDCTLGYFEALLKTVDLLFRKIELLYNRSQNKETLSWNNFNRISKEYNESINGYLEFGTNLNKLYKEMFV